MAIRWTAEELHRIGTFELDINVLEYFTAVYAVMLWGPCLVGTHVRLLVDNNAALSWINSGRVAARGGNNLCKLFSLYCLHHRIVITCGRISTHDNKLADSLSRYVLLQEDADLQHRGTTADGPWWTDLSRPQILRQLLLQSVTTPSPTAPLPLLRVLGRLL